MAKFRTIAMVGAMSIAGLGLIGVGAHAQFTTNTVSSQVVTSGNLSVVLYATGATNNGTANITLPAVGPTQSSFTTGDQVVTMYNNGNIGASEIQFSLNSTYLGSALEQGLYLCVTSTGLGVPFGEDYQFYNGTLDGAITASPFGLGGTVIPPGGSDSIDFNIYAGDQTTNCGTNGDGFNTLAPATSNAPDLGNSAMNESITISNTITYNG